MKAILVIDMPNSCAECSYCGFEQFTRNPACVICEPYFSKDEDIENNRSIICPLKPLPQKMEEGIIESMMDEYSIGWNDCLKEIEE